MVDSLKATIIASELFIALTSPDSPQYFRLLVVATMVVSTLVVVIIVVVLVVICRRNIVSFYTDYFAFFFKFTGK